MVGVIWIVQLILYPAFADIGPENFKSFHTRHSNRISFIVGPVMFIDLLTAIILAFESQFQLLWSLNLAGVGGDLGTDRFFEYSLSPKIRRGI